MRNPSLLGSLIATTAALSAQCVAPSSITTNPPDFSATHYLGSPVPPVSPDPGFSTMWNMAVSGPVTITQIDNYLYDDGVNPVQIGNTAPVTLWLCPTTYVGNELLPGNWIQVGTGTLTVADSNSHSPAVFSSPISLSPGTYGLALQVALTTAGPNPLGRLHPLITLPSVAPNTPLSEADQFLSITNETTQRISFLSGTSGVQTINIQIMYSPAPGSGYYSQFGQGCYFRPQSYYEYFQVPPANLDLSNQGITMINLGPNYQIIPGAPMTPFTPISAPVAGLVPGTRVPPPIMGDDDLSAAITLPFTFNAPGGVSTNQIIIGSNGYVYLTATAGSSFGFYDDIHRFLTDGPRLALAFGDLEPFEPASTSPVLPAEGGGQIYYDVDPSNAFVTITWDNVQEWAQPTAHINGQIVMYSSGQVDFRYGACNMVAAPVLTGYSVNDGNDPNSRDLSVGGAVVPFQTGDGQAPSVISASARPVIGTTIQIVTTNIQPGTFFSLLALSFGNIPLPGVDLGFVGMPGCKQYVATPVVTNLGPVISGQHSANLTIPNVVSYVGIQLYGESAPLTAGLNVANIVTSNALCMRIGN